MDMCLTKRVLLPVILVLMLLFTGCSVGYSASTDVPAALMGRTAPDFQLQDLNGEMVSLSGLRGKPVFINFWATWCPDCREEMPLIQQVYEEWVNKSPSLVVLAINVGESKLMAQNYMRENNLSFPALLDITQSVAQEYRTSSFPTIFPTSYFIDKNGMILSKAIGPFPNKESIEKQIEKIIH